MDFDKKNKTYKAVMLIITTALITFILTTTGMYNFLAKTDTGNAELLSNYIQTSQSTDNLKIKIEIIKRYLENHYIGELNEEEMLENAIKGYVEGIGDEYTEYLTKQEYEDLLISVTGNYVGIGIYMAQSIYGEIVVLLPIEGSPAEEAGIESGDIITKIDGEDCTGLDINVATSKIKGQENTTVDIEILRNDEIINKTVERRKIEIKYFDSKILDNGIGYIELLSFDEGSTELFNEQLQNLKEQNIKSLIIDLRNNGGGIVEEAIGIAEIFVPREAIIMKSYNKKGEEKIIKSSNSKPSDLEIVVLVNENSASATEIFAGAIQDNNIGQIVGKTTYGKGVMQEVIELHTGGALKVTIEEFKTPNGNEINKGGIIPDIEIENEENSEKDFQLEKAIEILK